MTPVVLAERNGNVGLITLNRPEAMNSLSAQLSAELDRAVRDLDQDPSIYVLVITGAGHRAFCTGADIKEMARREEQPETQPSVTPANASARLASSGKPTIAAINGVAIGGGALLASVVDIRIGCERSLFRFPGAAFGRINSTWTLPLIVGMPKAKELLFSARDVEAEEAVSMGLLNRLVPSDRLMDETLELARAIASHPADMIQAAKGLVHDYIGMRLPEMPRLEQEVREKLGTLPAKEVFKDFLGTRGTEPRG